MTFTYDASTDAGKVRLLIGDTDTDDVDRQIFSDAEISAFLAMQSGVVALAAADALEAIATRQALILKVVKIGDRQTDGAKLSDALLAQAERRRSEYYAGQETVLIERVGTPQQFWDRLTAEFLRNG